jgi:AcrR family transcriptional regulator
VDRREQILDRAEHLLDAEGPGALTMRRIADDLGIRAPSLYKHLRGKDDIVAALQGRALIDLAAALRPETGDPIALAGAYRRWALHHPHRYELTTRRELLRDRLPPGVEAAAAAPLVTTVGGDQHLARALWALAHGLVDLELAHRFPPGADLDRTWALAVARLAPPERPS